LFLFGVTIASTFLNDDSKDELIKKINSNSFSTWRAGHNEFVGSVMHLSPLEEGKLKGYTQVQSEYMPTDFDGRDAWPGCIHGVLNQGDCGSCWAFAATECLSDRTCIYSSGNINVTLSPQNLLSCEKLNLGCEMGSLPFWAWDFLEKHGVTTLDCVPYVSGDGQVPPCTDSDTSCTAEDQQFYLYKAQNYSQAGDFIDPTKHIEQIMAALLQGPVDATFNVYADFEVYKSGVYKHVSGGYEGLHSVKVIGYGVENGTDYWLVQNSWGANWGDDGFFKIIKGIDDCGFESLIYTGFPLL